MVILGTDKNGNGRLVEPSALPIPLLDTVECALPREIKHEQDGDSVVAHERQHVDKLSLTTKIPDAEGDFSVAYADSLLHEIDTQRLDVVLIPATLDVFDHQARLADLCIAHHADLDNHMVPAIAMCLAALTVAARPRSVIDAVVALIITLRVTAREPGGRS